MEIMRAVNLFVRGQEPNTFLAVLRSDSDQIFGGMLALPGGEIDLGEEAIKTASREFFEETGIQLEHVDPNMCMQTTVDLGRFTLIVDIYRARIAKQSSFQPQDTDIKAVQWVTPMQFVSSLGVHGYPKSEIKRFEEFLRSENFEL